MAESLPLFEFKHVELDIRDSGVCQHHKAVGRTANRGVLCRELDFACRLLRVVVERLCGGAEE
jgi:hypothetical protein